MKHEGNKIHVFSSEVIPKKVYFGPVPNAQQVALLQSENFKYIVNVMSFNEKQKYVYPIPPSSVMQVLYFPIPDQRVPFHVHHFLRWIEYLGKVLVHMKPDEKMYIHCRGGHGRSGLVAGCLFYWYSRIYQCSYITGEECINHMTIAHCRRQGLNPKYLGQKCPVAKCQQQFIKSLERMETVWKVNSKILKI